MSIRPHQVSILTWTRYNLFYLYIKVAVQVIKMSPCKVFLIRGFGFLLALKLMFINSNIIRWKLIVRFARHTKSTLPAWLYVIKYFVQTGVNRAWTIFYYEANYSIKKYITIENKELLQSVLAEEKGVMLLAAHYGPKLYGIMLHEMNIETKYLASPPWCSHVSKIVIKSLSCKEFLFLENSQRYLARRKSEKEFVRHLKSGGVVSMQIDYSYKNKEGKRIDFLGFPMEFSYFPFKLSLKYKTPILFYFFTKVKNGGYRLCFVPSGSFSTPAEGAKRYAAFFQAQITACPFMWDRVSDFMIHRNSSNQK